MPTASPIRRALPTRSPRRMRHGFSIIYGAFALTALCGVVSLAVDWGRVQVTRSQLQQAADAAAFYAAAGLPNGANDVQKRASASIGDNQVNGQAIDFRVNSDLDFGVWDQATHTFTVVTGGARSSATAVRVRANCIAARSTSLQLLFAKVIGKPDIDLTATTIVTRGKPQSVSVAANACPWLAGMPSGGTVPGSGGNATASTSPNDSPSAVTGIDIKPGTSLVFRQASGVTKYTGSGNYGPDGNTDWIVAQNAVNGINTTKAPLNCLVGIFLDDNAPNTTAMAAAGDFSSNGSRDFSTLAPPLKQVFFIGDGLDNSGKLQEFIVPPGTTRFYIGIMDEKGWWWDNEGSLSTTFMDDHLTLVK